MLKNNTLIPNTPFSPRWHITNFGITYLERLEKKWISIVIIYVFRKTAKREKQKKENNYFFHIDVFYLHYKNNVFLFKIILYGATGAAPNEWTLASHDESIPR